MRCLWCLNSIHGCTCGTIFFRVQPFEFSSIVILQSTIMLSPNLLDTAQSLAQRENLGSLLLHTKPARNDLVRWFLLSVLCLSPGFFMWVAMVTADSDVRSDDTAMDWIPLVLSIYIIMSLTGAASFIAYAWKKSKHQILLYEQGLIEFRNNKHQVARYKDLKMLSKGMRVTAYKVATLATAVDYTLVFPDGQRSRIDWSYGRRPVGAMIQGLIAQHKSMNVSS